MKKRRTLLFVLILVLALSISLFACNPPEKNDDDTETITWGEWKVELAPTLDSVGRITRTASNGEVDTFYLPALTDSHYKAEKISDPTCIEEGEMRYTINVRDKDYVFVLRTAKVGHLWGEEITYVWDEDGSACTASRVCQYDATHVDEAKATITSEQTKAPTFDTNGETTYTATFDVEWAPVDTKVVADIAKHVLSKVDRVEPTVNEVGNIEYYKGTDGKYYDDAKRTREITLESTVIPRLVPQNVAEVSATYGKDGVKAHYSYGATKYTKDEQGMYHEVTDADLVIPELLGTVTIYVNGTLQDKTISHKKGEDVTAEAVDQIVGAVDYAGLSYYEDSAKAKPIADITAYAKATKDVSVYVYKMYTITFDMAGGTSDINRAVIEYGDTYGALLVPTYDGWTFNGWYNAAGALVTADMVIEPKAHTLTAKWYDAGLEFAYIGGDETKNVVLTKYTGTASSLVIPEHIVALGNKPVTEIGDAAFVKETGGGPAVSSYETAPTTGVTSLTLPSTLTKIGASAFAGLQLESLDLPSGLKSIGDGAFAYMTELRSLVIPSSIEFIGYDIAPACYALERITIENGGNDLYVSSMNGVSFGGIMYVGKDTIPEREHSLIGTIPAVHPYDYIAGATKSTIPSGTKRIYSGAFDEVDSVGVEIPASVVEIMGTAFTDSSLSDVTFAEGTEPLVIRTQAFYDTQLAQIVLPTRISTIEADAFSENLGLKIYLANDSMPSYAAGWNNYSPTVQYPVYLYRTNAPTIADWNAVDNLFWHDVNGTPTAWVEPTYTITYEGIEGVTHTNVGDYQPSTATITLSAPTARAGYVFNGWRDKTTGRAVTTIPNASSGNIVLVADWYTEGLKFGATTIEGTELEANYTNNDAIVIVPSRVAAMDDLPVTEIARKAFLRGNVEKVVLPDTIKKIGEEAFIECYNLTDINIPTSLEYIGASAFLYTDIKKDIVLPKTVKYIGNLAFSDSSITGIKVDVENAYFSSRDSKGNECNVITYTGDAPYEIASNDGSPLSIGKGSILYFNNNFSTIPDNASAILGVEGAGAMEIPSNIKTLLPYAVIYSSITSITWADTTGAVMRDNAIWKNSSLTSVVLPHGLVSLGNNALSENDITSIIIPSTVTTLGSEVFTNNANLGSIYLEHTTMPSWGADWANKGTTTEVALAAVYLYSETNTVEGYDSSVAGYWHYVNGVPEVWDMVYDVEMILGARLMYGLTGAHGNGTEAVVPDTFDGAPIVEVGAGAFDTAPNVKKVTFGTNIESVETGTLSALALTDIKISNMDVTLEDAALNGSIATIVNYYGPTNVYYYMYKHGMKKNAESTLKTLEVFGTSGEKGSPIHTNDISTLVTFKCTNCANLLQLSNASLETICIDSVIVIDEYTFGTCPKLKELYVPFAKDYLAIRDPAFAQFLEEAHVVVHYGYNNKVTDDGLYGYRLEDGILYLLEYLGSSTEVVVPEYIGDKKIDEYYAFAGDKKITKMSFAEGMIDIPQNLANSMSSLTTIDITNIQNIGNNAFLGCSALVNVNFTGGVNIGDSAFSHTGLQELVLDERIGTIGKSAFANCTALTKVTIGANVTSLPANAFKYNTALTSVILPESMESIGAQAFYNIGTPEAKATIVMPNSITTMPDAAIFGSSNIAALCFRADVPDEMLAAAVSQVAPKYIYAESNPAITADFAGTWSYDEAHNVVINDSEYYTLEKYFDGSAEYNKDAYKITGYTNPAATYDLVIPDTYRGVTIRAIQDNAFKGDTKLSSVVINNKFIGASAFQSCTNLGRVTLAINSIDIGQNAFSGCTALTSIYIPMLTKIGEYAFDGCGLETITFEEIASSYEANIGEVSSYAFRGAKITELTLVEGKYRDYAFDSCASLTKVTMPYGGAVSIIESRIFNNCPLLKTIEGSTNLIRINNDLDVANINIGTFRSVYGGARVKHITIGPNVGITSDTFGSIGAIPESVTIAPEHTDVEIDANGNIIWTNGEGKKVLLLAKTSTIPADINIIGARAFAYTSYTSVEIPRNVNRIEAYAFASSGLTSMTIPRNIQYVGLCAFADCASLSTITARVSEASVQTWDTDWKKDYTGSVNVDSTLRSGDYTYDLDIDDNAKLLEYHGNFNVDKIIIPDEIDGYKVTKIGTLLRNKTGPKSIVLNQYITELPEFFCLNCDTLTSVDLKNVQRIGSNAFSRTGLTSIDLKNVTYIGGSAFEHTKISGEIVIPATMTEIGNHAFNYISTNHAVRFEVDSITQKSALKTIGGAAFLGITQKDLVLPEGLEVVKNGAFDSSTGDGSYLVSVVENITLPSTLIDFYPRVLCSGGINKFTVHPDNKYYKTIDNGNALVYIGDETRTYQDGDYANQLLLCSISKNYILNTTKSFTTIPDDGSIVGIGPYAFEYTTLSQITVPATIVEIGTSAFSSASLTRVEVLGSGLKTIGAGAFLLMGEAEPAEIILPEGIINMGEYINTNPNTTIRVRGPEPAVRPTTWAEAWYYNPRILEDAAKVVWDYAG